MQITIDMQDGSPVRKFDIQEKFEVLCHKARAIVALKCNVPIGSLQVIPYVSGVDPTSLSYIEVIIQKVFLNEYVLGGSFTKLCVGTVYGEKDEYMGNITPSGITLSPTDWENILHNSEPCSVLSKYDEKTLRELTGNLGTIIRGMVNIERTFPEVGDISEMLGVGFTSVMDRYQQLKATLEHELHHKELFDHLKK